MAVPDRIKTQSLFNEAVVEDPDLLAYTTDHLKTQEMCDEAVRNNTYTLRFIPDHLKRQECATNSYVPCRMHFILFLTILKLKGCALGKPMAAVLCP